MDARRLRMRSGNGLCAITDDECSVVVKPDPVVAMVVTKKPPLVGGVIATDMTGELTPHGSECGDRVSRSNSIAELTPTWTLSALQRLSVEEQTTLGRKLGGAGPVARNKSGTSPEPTADSPFRVVLQNAVVQGDLEAAAAALKSGADPNERDDLRHSSLHFAASRGDVRCLRKLMRSGARANVANNVGWSPLHYAVLGGHVEVVEVLLRAGAYPCFRDNHLISPLHLASTQTGAEAGKRKTFQQMAKLLGPSALVARDELEQTPLHVAASCGNRDAVAVLLELNADPEAKDRKGHCPGHSWLRQVSKRARADILSALEAAIDRRNAQAAAAAAADDEVNPCPSSSLSPDNSPKSWPDSGGDARVNVPLEEQSRASSVCLEAAPVLRPSVLNLLPAGWGLGGSRKCGEGGVARGEASFGIDTIGVSCASRV